MSKHLGIDYGTKRIGIAISDEGEAVAFPLTTIPGGKGALEEIASIAEREGVEVIVLGESKDLSGNLNPVAGEAEELKRSLEARGFSVVYEPEFLSSTEAARQFAPDDSRKKNPPQKGLDASAAAIILQSYLDRQKRQPEVE